MIAEAHRAGPSVFSPAIGGTRWTRLPGLAPFLSLPRRLVRFALGTPARLARLHIAPFVAAGGSPPGLAGALGTAMLDGVIATAPLRRAPIRSGLKVPVAIAFGASKPRAQGFGATALSQNRRVEFIITKTRPAPQTTPVVAP